MKKQMTINLQSRKLKLFNNSKKNKNTSLSDQFTSTLNLFHSENLSSTVFRTKNFVIRPILRPAAIAATENNLPLFLRSFTGYTQTALRKPVSKSAYTAKLFVPYKVIQIPSK